MIAGLTLFGQTPADSALKPGARIGFLLLKNNGIGQSSALKFEPVSGTFQGLFTTVIFCEDIFCTFVGFQIIFVLS